MLKASTVQRPCRVYPVHDRYRRTLLLQHTWWHRHPDMVSMILPLPCLVTTMPWNDWNKWSRIERWYPCCMIIILCWLWDNCNWPVPVHDKPYNNNKAIPGVPYCPTAIATVTTTTIETKHCPWRHHHRLPMIHSWHDLFFWFTPHVMKKVPYWGQCHYRKVQT